MTALNFSINVQFSTRADFNDGAVIDDMFSSKFMFAPNLCNSSWWCVSDVQALHPFPGEPWALEDRGTCWIPPSGESANATLGWATIARAEGKHHPPVPESASRFTRITVNVLQQAARCHQFSAKKAAEDTSTEEEQHREVEQHPGSCKWKQGKKACVRIIHSHQDSKAKIGPGRPTQLTNSTDMAQKSPQTWFYG